MTTVKNGMVIICAEPDDTCSYCGKISELRPYGKDGARICFDCGMKPENKEETDRRINMLFDSAKPINPNHQ